MAIDMEVAVVTCPTVAYIKRQITYMNEFFKNVYCKEMLNKLLQNTAAERKVSVLCQQCQLALHSFCD